jgi:Fe-S-cluster-containing hydrogenase component 2
MHPDPDLNRVAWDETKCIGCRMCMIACPFGAVVYETPRSLIKMRADVSDFADSILRGSYDYARYLRRASKT